MLGCFERYMESKLSFATALIFWGGRRLRGMRSVLWTLAVGVAIGPVAFRMVYLFSGFRRVTYNIEIFKTIEQPPTLTHTKYRSKCPLMTYVVVTCLG